MELRCGSLGGIFSVQCENEQRARLVRGRGATPRPEALGVREEDVEEGGRAGGDEGRHSVVSRSEEKMAGRVFWSGVSVRNGANPRVVAPGCASAWVLQLRCLMGW